MFIVDLQSRTPVWEQLVSEVGKYVLLGLLKPEDKLPSVRELAVDIGVNPNTITKAYTELNRLGIVVSAGGRGCYVDRNAFSSLKKQAENRLPEFSSIARDLILSGIPANVLIDVIKKEEGKL